MPPIPWTPKTANASSILIFSMSLTAPKQIAPAPNPIMIAGIAPTKPAAGVMATRPATAPVAAPTALGFPATHQDSINQVTIAVAAAVFVTTKAFTAVASAANALPALKPNHPNHSRLAPSTTIGTLAGPIGCWRNPTLFPTTKAAAKAPNPALICTTVPPAKSNAGASLKREPSQPPPQTQ